MNNITVFNKAALIWAAFLIGGSAFGQTSLSLASGSSAAGGSLPLNLSLTNSSAPSALEWTFSFAPGDVTSVSVTAGSALTAAGKTVSCNNSSGKVKCLATGMNATAINNGVVAVATATLAPSTSTGSVPVSVDSPLGSTATGTLATVNGTGGTITVSGWQPPAVTVKTLACTPASVVTPATSSCTVTLSGAAPTGGVSVALAGTAVVTVPAAITIASGSSTGTFNASALSVTTTQTAAITASLNGSTQSFSLTLQPFGTAQGLVAAYGFGEGSGATTADASSNGNAGTISGATWTTAGKFGSALVFNGAGAIVNINDSATLHLSAGMTLEAWVKPSAVNNAWADVIYKGNDAYFLEGTSDSSSVPAAGGTFGGVGAATYGASALPLNVWTHLAQTYDGQNLSLYVNGALVSLRAQTGSIPTSTDRLQIGGDSIFGQYFAGVIDEVRVYNRALTQAQIQSDMNTAINSGGSPTPASVTSLQCSPTTIAGGATSTCTVTLSQAAPTGGASVALSDNSTALTVPASVTVAAGASSATFAATDGSVTDNTAVTVTAALNGSSKTASITVSAPAPSATVSALACAPTTIASGATSTCTVTLSQAAPTGGSSVALSDDSTALTTPAAVTVAAGASTATFAVTAGSVTANTAVTVTSALNGSSKTASITVSAPAPSVTVSSLVCAPTTIAPGATSTCTVTLTTAAPAGGSSVALSDNSAYLTVPLSVTVAAGASTATFAATAGSATVNTAVIVFAALNGASKTASITIQPVAGATNLVAAYSFSEGSGTTVTDLSGNGNTGTISNAAWTTGKYGSGLLFNGFNSWVTVNDSASLHLSTGMTLEAWVMPSAVNDAWSDVIYKGGDAYFLEATSDRKSVPGGGGTFGTGRANSVAYGPTAVSANTWTHLALTYDGATLRLYVNGVPASSRGVSGSILASTTALQIGGDSTFGQYFKGVIDEVRIYNTARTQAEIQSDASTPLGQ